MGDVDMNATPLNKLGPPAPAVAMQSKKDAAPVQAVSYADMLKQMNDDLSHAGNPGLQPTPQQHAGLPHAALQHPGLPHAALQHPGVQQHAVQQMQYPLYEDEIYDEYEEPPRRKRDRRPGGGWQAKVRHYRSSILAALVMFLVLLYVAPRLSHLIPQLLNPMGRFNVAGYFTVAVIAGFTHHLAEAYLPS